MSTAAQGLTPLESYRELTDFARRCGENALRLAMHAAVPQSFRADLLHLLKLNFLPDAVRDPAVEADVLLAPFTEDLSGGYYQFDPEVRRQLIERLNAAHPQRHGRRIEAVARFLSGYIAREEERLEASADPLREGYLEIQRWVALAYLDPDSAARQLAYALANTEEAKRAAVRLQVGGLIRSLSAPLATHPELLVYAAGLRALEEGRFQEGQQMLQRLGQGEVQVAGVKLRAVDAVISEWRGRAPAEKAVERGTILVVTEAVSDWADEPVRLRWLGKGFRVECLGVKEVWSRTEEDAIRFVRARNAAFVILDERFLPLDLEQPSAILGLPSLPVVPLWRPRLASAGARDRYLSHRMNFEWWAAPVDCAEEPGPTWIDAQVQTAVASIREWASAPGSGILGLAQQVAFFERYGLGSREELRSRFGEEVARHVREAREASDQGDLARARLLFESLTTAYRVVGDEATSAEALAGLAEIVTKQGDFGRARELWERVLRTSQETRARSMELRAVDGLGEVYAGLGDRDRAIEFTAQALQLAQELRHPRMDPLRARLEGLEQGREAQSGDPRDTAEVFINYAFEDQQAVSTISDYLESRGIRCWHAARDIRPGAPWESAIQRAMQECRVVLVIMSQASFKSQAVLAELGTATASKKTIIPVRIDSSEQSREMFSLMARHVSVDATGGLEGQLPKVYEAVRSWLDQSAEGPGPTAGGRGHIYVGYAQADLERIAPLMSALQGLGYDVVWDPRVLPPPSNVERFQQAMDLSACVLVVWTSNARSSGSVMREVLEGQGRHTLVLALLDDIPVPAIGELKPISLVGWNGDTKDPRFSGLVEAIEAVVRVRPDDAPAAQVKPAESRVEAVPPEAKKPSLFDRVKGLFTGEPDREPEIRSKVYISYRRGDAAAYAGRVYEALSKRVGRGGQIFMDVDIQPGEDFEEAIRKRLRSSQVMLVLIGEAWLSAPDESGRRRLNNRESFVFLEIRVALEARLRVIPVLVGDVTLPPPSDLPENLRGLLERQAVTLSDDHWEASMANLIGAIAHD